MKHKSRKQKLISYIEQYSEIPKDNIERLSWLCDVLNIQSENKMASILDKKETLLRNMYFSVFKIILYEEPEGSPRPRFRIVNRSNLANMAMTNSQFVHVYSLTGAEDRVFMNRLLRQEEFTMLNGLIYTPCDVDYITFFKTPSYYSATDKILAEIGLQRPLTCYRDWETDRKSVV